MPESGFHRPRRAFAHDTDSDEPIAADDTSAPSAGTARRGVESQTTQPVGEPVGDVTQGDATEVGGETPTQYENPFARPGSDSVAAGPAPVEHLVPAPAPVLPARDFESLEDSGTGRRMGGMADGPTPEPRRSAVSSTTPPERDATPVPPVTGEQQSWLEHHRRTLLIWGIGALVAALLVVFGFYVAGRQVTGNNSPSPSPSPSPSTSVSAVPPVTEQDLITVADADKIVPGASWAITKTTETSAEAKQRITCLSTYVSDVNPTDSFQRAMGSSQDDKLAALHQVDIYANASAAREVQTARMRILAACDEVPAHIESATTITGLADDVTQITVSVQNDPIAFHTVLLVRTGRALTMLDVTRNGGAVDAAGAADALVRSLGDMCSRVDGMCPATPAATAAVPPPVPPEGWLTASDLPRLRPGYGRWTVTEPADITSQGMGCENLPLATEPGPTGRAQRTYLITQDDSTPETFGIDEIALDFTDNTAANAFTTKLINSLLSCKDRLLTAKVTDGGSVSGAGADGVAVAARMITIDQAISDTSTVRYQLVVAIANGRVSYLLATVTDTYQFSESQLTDLALRTAQRNSQG